MRSIAGFIKQLILDANFRLNYSTKRIQTNDLKKQGRLLIGEYSYGLPIVINYNEDRNVKVIIGKFCSIADNLRIILGGQHHTDWISTYPFRVVFSLAGADQDRHPLLRGDVIIQNDVWIGRDVLIFDGVTIGNGAVIGSGSVVTKDVAPYEIVAGNPCRRIRMRFSDEEIVKLLKIAWWDWDISKILDNVHLLLSPNINNFIQKFYNESV